MGDVGAEAAGPNSLLHKKSGQAPPGGGDSGSGDPTEVNITAGAATGTGTDGVANQKPAPAMAAPAATDGKARSAMSFLN
jgi:hypothetical protein